MRPDDPRVLAVAAALVDIFDSLDARRSTAPDDLLSLVVAATIAATTVRVLREAIRTGDLPAYGRQRDRAVRRADIDKWIATRRATPTAGVDDRDIARRMGRLRGVRSETAR
jgi:hypothetical protein